MNLPRKVQVAGCYCCGNEPSVSVLGGEYFDHLSKYMLAFGKYFDRIRVWAKYSRGVH
jgi:hypothetical protein